MTEWLATVGHSVDSKRVSRITARPSFSASSSCCFFQKHFYGRSVPRVRFTEQDPRALDIARTFQQILLRRKPREGVANGEPRGSRQLAACAAQRKPRDPVTATSLRAKNGLDSGVHFNLRDRLRFYQTRFSKN